MSISDYFNQTADFKTFNSTSTGALDSLGAPDLSSGNYTNISTGVSVLLRPMGAREKVARGKKVSDRLFTVYSTVVSAIEGDIIVIGSSEYTIIGFTNPNSLGHHIEWDCEEIV